MTARFPDAVGPRCETPYAGPLPHDRLRQHHQGGPLDASPVVAFFGEVKPVLGEERAPGRGGRLRAIAA